MDKDLSDMLYEMFVEEDTELAVLEDGDWIDDGKYSFRESIVEYKSKTYKICEYRSGSYYTDYDYGDPTIIEVKKRVEMVPTTFWDKV